MSLRGLHGFRAIYDEGDYIYDEGNIINSFTLQNQIEMAMVVLCSVSIFLYIYKTEKIYI